MARPAGQERVSLAVGRGKKRDWKLLKRDSLRRVSMSCNKDDVHRSTGAEKTAHKLEL